MCFKWLQFGAMVVPCKKLLTFLLLRSLIQLLYLTVQTLARSNELFLWLFAVGGPLLFLIQVRGRSWMTSRDLQGRTVCKFCRKSSSYFQRLPPPTANTSLISYRPNVKLFDYLGQSLKVNAIFPKKYINRRFSIHSRVNLGLVIPNKCHHLPFLQYSGQYSPFTEFCIQLALGAF